MKIQTDTEARTAIESLCHSAMAHCDRESFLSNLRFVNHVLLSMEMIPEPVAEPLKPEQEAK